MLQAVAARLVQVALACVVATTCTLAPSTGLARGNATEYSAASISLAQLPPQGRTTYKRIHEGGPFPYDKDGTVFGNRERLLPRHQRGYYREYTVKTPGVRHRGARRIVCGGAPRTPDICYYSDDHYASFREITP
ncbi:MAG: ribonuclease [Acidovorax sp.]|jgi:ribonuclease T1|nr:ribonuclease [Acidovorax sp.]